jgi:predicted nucleic acid-binding protein
MIAVSNTSPLILLDKAKCLWVLGKLFKKVIIPPAVNTEWLRPGGYVVPDSRERPKKGVSKNTCRMIYISANERRVRLHVTWRKSLRTFGKDLSASSIPY